MTNIITSPWLERLGGAPHGPRLVPTAQWSWQVPGFGRSANPIFNVKKLVGRVMIKSELCVGPRLYAVLKLGTPVETPEDLWRECWKCGGDEAARGVLAA